MTPRVLFVGDAWIGSNALSMANGFQVLGAETLIVDTSVISTPSRFTPAWAHRKATDQAAPWHRRRMQRDLEQIAHRFRPDLLFCFKSVRLDQELLLSLPARVRVHYSPDDASNPANTTPEYLTTESQWDTVVTTKVHNVPELTARGVQDVLHVWSAYDPTWHFPHARISESTHTVGFIGVRRPDREQLISSIAARFGKDVLVCGPKWGRMKDLRRSATVEPGKFGQAFSETISRITANLVLLNSENRDTHTCRSFEVPAAGGLVVGERTGEHQQLLDDGTEALFFSDEEELMAILDRCRRSDPALADIARRGYRRITDSAHTYADRAASILGHVGLADRRGSK